jgi:polysaccharide export outer membrane protein
MKKSFLVFCLCLVLIVPFITTQVCLGEEKASVSTKKESAETDKNSYKIGSGDILEIFTWKEPDFSRDVSVRIDGKFTFPLLDDIQAAGRTTMQVKKEMETKLREFIEDPVVTVILKTPGSQKFYILGEVGSTGEYHLAKQLTILQAFALAGGFTEWASRKSIILLRREDGKERILKVNYKDIIKGKHLEQNVFIKVNDTIIVP